ncbi:NAD(P) transhydrogenase subunit alpha [uncultured Mobiluncus sp.]|uniref:NAD(P) transhydrogenase subunit alpha n=1 Tax=uncultured Mobiluncus sp. TaxID=293425 RepID=UPI00260439EC|nr:NAD(P) transhydrogenase subunit alpha [uncultured Mobiluncus sp.]
MTPFQGVLLVVLVVFTLVGYKIISHVPSLLHTPLMSGMNAFSGVTVLGCLSAAALAVSLGSKALGLLAVALAMVNIVGGFGVTDRMLRMFDKKHKPVAGGGTQAGEGE